MTYLLDVNALVALGFLQHQFHDRVALWLRERQFPDLATCSITELGFARVLSQSTTYGLTLEQARATLLSLKGSHRLKFRFIADNHDLEQLPGWVKTPSQTTDGHLARLATAHGAVLATLDAKIAGAHLIP